MKLKGDGIGFRLLFCKNCFLFFPHKIRNCYEKSCKIKERGVEGRNAMIANAAETLIENQREHFLISADKVANVFESNPLNHAFLEIKKVRYSKIPVLDNEQHFKGLISLAMITDSMLGLNGIDPTGLSEQTVADVMQRDVPTVTNTESVEELLHLLVDQPFLVVTDQQNVFQGIITRREIMKAVNYMVHELDHQYQIEKRE